MPTTLPNATVSDGLQRFTVLLEELAVLIRQSKRSKNPALFLFESGTRNQLFKLEALGRIYRKIGSKKVFEPLYDEFKVAEDQFGKIDYYHAFYKEFSILKKIPLAFKRYFLLHRDEEIKKMNSLIQAGNIISSEAKIQETLNVLAAVKWPEREQERKDLALFLTEQIDRFIEQYEGGELNFHNIESGVHEFRRKLRWLSIYAQALNGLIQLKKTKYSSPDLQVYMEREIVESPFNKMPSAGKGIKPLYIRSCHFYALSWMIQESGRLKDAGLRTLAIREAIRDCKIQDKETVSALKKQLLPAEHETAEEITERMENLADDFIYRHRVLFLIRRDLMRGIQS